jgi:hypothetical protein
MKENAEWRRDSLVRATLLNKRSETVVFVEGAIRNVLEIINKMQWNIAGFEVDVSRYRNLQSS